ncbi:hypothetical protein LOZ53_001041 [Ophidiomyces ophidiicola]|uniref:Uncharacterized protein n=1 Tax=Ophidiomyces ophidiicola TaxID=1387563 RepID=A0ACB8UXI2_9EURO|nr:hypothetical protein LOZ64_004273 [Ophidiomyces ophidiicola]KAI1926786.1 hypothetical protein LOZ60_003383 [Ophidiomyces ophidiicola]KAI1945946.1 hypothetical protein LOZ62_003549 [Ophidiomyces ophidiicola]KAI1971465.1 hypothetical protein LOZ56_003034 [Ophidiomyces ophidiicola]KAI1996440.1 hypothetical protein LOZ53_001041 [Ophidiomyces ophidiicola]
MPIKWTPEVDQLLLLKILETHDLTVDPKKVSDAWPKSNPNAIPTPRAISERLFRMKKVVKDNANFTESPGQETPKKTPTPKRRKRNDSETPSSKRSRVKKEPKLELASSPLGNHGDMGAVKEEPYDFEYQPDNNDYLRDEDTNVKCDDYA